MPNKVKFTLGATLPTRIQYENVQPLVEVEADTFEEARDLALKQIQSVAELVRDNKPMILNIPSQATVQPNVVLSLKTCDVTGSEVFMDEVEHTYQDEKGEVYLSGSTFSHKFIAQFPADTISGVMATKYNLDQEDILGMWKTNAEASTSLGTGIHAALELYGKYLNVSMTVKNTAESALHKNPFLKQAVEVFYKGRQNENARYEVFVVDAEKKLCGFIDRLLVIDADKKICRVQDYKTNPDLQKKQQLLPPFKGVLKNTALEAYWLQLSFYAYILQKAGWTVEGLDIFNICAREQEGGSLRVVLDTYQHEVLDINEALTLIKGK